MVDESLRSAVKSSRKLTKYCVNVQLYSCDRSQINGNDLHYQAKHGTLQMHFIYWQGDPTGGAVLHQQQ